MVGEWSAGRIQQDEALSSHRRVSSCIRVFPAGRAGNSNTGDFGIQRVSSWSGALQTDGEMSSKKVRRTVDEI